MLRVCNVARKSEGNDMAKSGQHKGVKIRTRGNAWQVDFGTRDGKREMRSFKTQEEAKRAINARVEDDKISARNQRNG